MSLVPMDGPTMTNALKGDAMQLRTFIDWVGQRYGVYNQNCTTQNMTDAGISGANQSLILAFIGDLNRIKLLAAATLPGSATDIVFNLNNMLGVV